MNAKWVGILLLACCPAMAQTVFTNGVNVGGRAVQGVGLIDIANTNLLWGSMVPSLAQLAGLNPANGAGLDSAFLVPLRPAWLETDGIYARTTNGLTFYDENGVAVLTIRAGALWSAGGNLSTLPLNTGPITGGQLACTVMAVTNTLDAGGLTLGTATLSDTGAVARGISVPQLVGLGSTTRRNASLFVTDGQSSSAETYLQQDSYAPDLGTSIMTNAVVDTNTIIVTGTGFPATLSRSSGGDGQYYLFTGLPDLRINIAWTEKSQSVMGDYWTRISGAWYLAYTCSGSPNAPTGTLTAVNTVYLWGSGTAADAAYVWNNTSSVWTNMMGYWIATNAVTQGNELWGSSGTTNVLLATNNALNGDWVAQSNVTQLIWTNSIWGTIPMTMDISGNASFAYNDDNIVKITTDGNLHYLAHWCTNSPQADIICGHIASGTLVGAVTLFNGFLVQGTENDGFYAWNDTSSRYELNGYFITANNLAGYDLYSPSALLLYNTDFNPANPYRPWYTSNGVGVCHSGLWAGGPQDSTGYGEPSAAISTPSSFYPNQSDGVSRFSTVTYQTNKLSVISGLATTALQPGANLSNLTGQLRVTALPTGTGQTWNAGGLTLSNVTVSGNGMGLTNVQGSAIVGLSASQITSGLLNPAVLSTNGTWDVGGLLLTNVKFAAGTLSTPTLAQVLAAGNDGGGQTMSNVIISGNGSGLTNLLGSAITGFNASQISTGKLSTAVMPTGGVWNTAGLVLTNAQFFGTGMGLTGLTIAQISGLGSAATNTAAAFATAAQGTNAVAAYNAITANDVAIGNGAYAWNNGTAVGAGADAHSLGVAVGKGASGTPDGVAVGYEAISLDYGVALGLRAKAYGVGNISIGSSPDTGSYAIVPTTLNYTAEIGVGTASSNGWFHYRGNPVIDPTGGVHGVFLGNGAGLTNVPVNAQNLTNLTVAQVHGLGSAATNNSADFATAVQGTNAAAAYNAVTANNLALGNGAYSWNDGTAVGESSTATVFGVSVGLHANGTGGGVALGLNANGSGLGVALGENADGHGAGNVAIGGSNGSGLGAVITNGFTDTAIIGRGAAVSNGWFHYRGNPVIDPTGGVHGVFIGDGSGLTNVTWGVSNAAQLTNGILPATVLPQGGVWNAGGLLVTNLVVATYATSGNLTEVSDQFATFNDLIVNHIANTDNPHHVTAVQVGAISSTDGTATNLTVVGALYLEDQSDLLMGSFTNRPGL